jgi:hypothetical protein
MATLTLDIKSTLPLATRWVQGMERQLPFAVSVALNQSAFDARTAINTSTTRYFSTPTRFTQNAFFVQRSSKQNLEAIVFAEAGKGRDRARYLRYGIQGGTRRQKGFERKFLSEVAGTARIPAGSQLVPTRLVGLDAAGNVSLATIKRIQKGLGGSQRGGFFVGQPRNNPGLPPGIYRRSREQLFPYFLVADSAARYTPRFPIDRIGGEAVERSFMRYFEGSLAKALASAR